MWETEISISCLFIHVPSRDWTRNLGMCPDRESHPRPFGGACTGQHVAQDNTPTNWATRARAKQLNFSCFCAFACTVLYTWTTLCSLLQQVNILLPDFKTLKSSSNITSILKIAPLNSLKQNYPLTVYAHKTVYLLLLEQYCHFCSHISISHWTLRPLKAVVYLLTIATFSA